MARVLVAIGDTKTELWVGLSIEPVNNSGLSGRY